jgi:tripartite-type tricarboxylate transporter receptor subunit TctC
MKKITCLKFLQTFVVCVSLLSSTYLIAQDTFPSRPIVLITPLSAGSQIDIIARGLAEAFSKVSNQPMVVQNREGASSIIGVDAVAKAKPDGYTLGFGPDGAFVIQFNPTSMPTYPTKAKTLISFAKPIQPCFCFWLGLNRHLKPSMN